MNLVASSVAFPAVLACAQAQEQAHIAGSDDTANPENRTVCDASRTPEYHPRVQAGLHGKNRILLVRLRRRSFPRRLTPAVK
jgi:hypothetical protein